MIQIAILILFMRREFKKKKLLRFMFKKNQFIVVFGLLRLRKPFV